MQTRELEPLVAQIQEPFDGHWETYRFSSPTARVVGAICLAAFGLLGLIPALGGAPLGSLLLGLLWTVSVSLVALLYLGRPYEVRISPAGLVRFIGLWGCTDIDTADILRLVRYERPGRGELDHFMVGHRRGSVTLHTDRDDIFDRLRALNPGCQVSTVVYDPDGD